MGLSFFVGFYFAAEVPGISTHSICPFFLVCRLVAKKPATLTMVYGTMDYGQLISSEKHSHNRSMDRPPDVE
jgi:hypothetical protein